MHPTLRRYSSFMAMVAVGVAAAQAGLILGVVQVHRSALTERMTAEMLAVQGELVDEEIASGRPWRETEQRLREHFVSVAEHDEMALYDDAGRLLLRSSGRLEEMPLELSPEQRAHLDAGETGLGGDYLVLVVGAARDVGGHRYYIVRVDRMFQGALARALPLGVGALLVSTLLLGVAGGYLILRLTSRQLQKVDRVLRMMSAGDLSARLSLPVDPETAGVVLSFNAMAEKVETNIEKLRRSDESRRQLLADVTHELNTPLTSVLGYLETLTMDDLPLSEERRHRLTEIAYEEAVNLRALIEDLTTLSRLETEGLTIERARVPLAPVVERVARRLSQIAEKRGVPVRTELDPDVAVRGDAQRLDQVVRNLLENAIRHTSPPGGVTVSVGRAGGDALLEVRDQGTGMPPDALAQIGRRFLRVDKSRARNTGGRGLGLAISVGLVEAHGGRVHFESELGSGTRVQVRLPALPSTARAAEAGRAVTAGPRAGASAGRDASALPAGPASDPPAVADSPARAATEPDEERGSADGDARGGGERTGS